MDMAIRKNTARIFILVDNVQYDHRDRYFCVAIRGVKGGIAANDALFRGTGGAGDERAFNVCGTGLKNARL